MNGDGTRDLVVADSFPSSTQFKLYYYYGTLSTAGTVSSWNIGFSSGEINLNKEDVGISIPYPTTRIGTISYSIDEDG